MKWELDLWYEMWDRVGSQGLDTWYELPKQTGGGRDVHPPPDTTSSPSEAADGGRE